MSTSAPSSHSLRHVARMVIEFITPFHVGLGDGGYGADALVVTDANGLPAIPGSSLAGALRAAFQERTGSDQVTNELFGYQDGDKGQGSRLSLSWALMHDRNDRPVEGILARSCIQSDEVLRQGLTLCIRDHVQLNHRGAADHRRKFDEQPVAAGHRFTFEMELVETDSDPTHPGLSWKEIMAALCGRTLRLGGKSRRGYGAFRVIRISSRCFDLRKSEDFAAYASLPASLAQRSPALFEENPPQGSVSPGSVQITLRVQPRGYWMFGGGEDVPPLDAKPADAAPVREEKIIWEGGTGRVQPQMLLLPGSAIKGAISHRLAFHDNRLNGRFADNLAGADDDPGSKAEYQPPESTLRLLTGIYNPAVRELFGFVPESRSASEKAERGRVLLDDQFWAVSPPLQQRVPHVSIDRFTSGAADSKLFSERPLWQGDFPDIKLTVLNAEHVTNKTRQALKAALSDLVEGRLALGAGAGRGLGYFEPRAGAGKSIECSAGDDWFNGNPVPNTTEESHD